jgi:hypothetical protein
VVECGALEKRCASDWRTGSSNLPPSVSTPAARHKKYAAERPELASWLPPERSRARREIPRLGRWAVHLSESRRLAARDPRRRRHLLARPARAGGGRVADDLRVLDHSE